jgi:hypothetical protein
MLFLYIQAVANERSYVIRNSDRRSIPQWRLLTHSAAIKTCDVLWRFSELRRCLVVLPVVDPTCLYIFKWNHLLANERSYVIRNSGRCSIPRWRLLTSYCVRSRGTLFARWKEQAVPVRTMLTTLIGGPSCCGAWRGVSTVGKQERCLLFYMRTGCLGERASMRFYFSPSTLQSWSLGPAEWGSVYSRLGRQGKHCALVKKKSCPHIVAVKRISVLFRLPCFQRNHGPSHGSGILYHSTAANMWA